MLASARCRPQVGSGSALSVGAPPSDLICRTFAPPSDEPRARELSGAATHGVETFGRANPNAVVRPPSTVPGAQGSVGYPNLNDDHWLWGGSLEDIHRTLAHGIRYGADPETRASEMPAFGEILEPAQITEVSNFVASLSGTPGEANEPNAGREVFAQHCAACHGQDGKGNRELGAPNLTDAIWLYGSSPAEIAAYYTEAYMADAAAFNLQPAADYHHGLAPKKQLQTWSDALTDLCGQFDIDPLEASSL